MEYRGALGRLVSRLGGPEPRYGWFLTALLTLTLTYAIAAGTEALRIVIDLMFFLLLLPAIRLIFLYPRLRWVGIVLGLLALIANGVFVVVPDQWTTFARDALTAALLITATTLILLDVLKPGRISWNKIAGAISVYLLIGFCFAFIFAMIDAVQPHAFPLETVPRSAGERPPDAPFLYYSFVTLTTLGYGDILPYTPAARTLSWMEAVIGQLYLTILVARLVGLHIAQATGRIKHD